MPIETASYISQLVDTNPAGTDERKTADDHLRLIKAVLSAQFPNFTAAAVNATVSELNLVASYNGSSIPDFTEVGQWSAQQYFGEETLSDGVNISWNLTTSPRAKVTLGGDRTLDNPTNMVAGNFYFLRVIQDGTGGRLLSFGSAYKWTSGDAPYLSPGANAVDIISCTSDGTYMFCSLMRDFS